jgi:hypothetical protein
VFLEWNFLVAQIGAGFTRVQGDLVRQVLVYPIGLLALISHELVSAFLEEGAL